MNLIESSPNVVEANCRRRRARPRTRWGWRSHRTQKLRQTFWNVSSLLKTNPSCSLSLVLELESNKIITTIRNKGVQEKSVLCSHIHKRKSFTQKRRSRGRVSQLTHTKTKEFHSKDTLSGACVSAPLPKSLSSSSSCFCSSMICSRALAVASFCIRSSFSWKNSIFY